MNRQNQVLRVLIGLVVAATSVPGGATFPDAPTEEFDAVGMIGNIVDGKLRISGCGVAIAEDWVISVGHVGGKVFEQGGVKYAIEKKFFHKASSGESADIALFKLKAPVTHAEVSLAGFEGSNGLKGRTVHLVGYGKTAKLRTDGLGWQPVEGSEGKKRVAVNTIDVTTTSRYNLGSELEPKWKNTSMLVYDLDKPGSGQFNSLGGLAVAGEGGVGARDSGGGWFVKEGAHYRLVALSATVAKGPDSSMPNPYCYGGLGYGVYLRSYKAWIYAITQIPAFK